MNEVIKVAGNWKRYLPICQKLLFLILIVFLLGVPHLDFMVRLINKMVLGVFLVTYVLFILMASLCKKDSCWRRLWWAGFVLDMVLISYLLGTCGHLMSSFVLLYPLVMLGAAVSGPGIRDFLVAGTLGHLSYAVGAYTQIGNLSFYQTQEFWMGGGLNGASFLFATQVVRTVNAHLHQVQLMAEEIKAKNERLEELALTDGLTGLFNHRYFWERLEEEIERANRHKYPLSLLMIDVDFFKLYNDRHGHLEGDNALCQLGTLLKNEVRQGDVVFRYGGEEFAIILPGCESEDGLAVAGKVRKAVLDFPFRGGEVLPGGKLTISIGVACYPRDASGIRELVNRADNALYGAKQHNKNKVQSYNALMADLRQEGMGEENLVKTLQTLVAIINGKDGYTGGHSERVAEYVGLLARKLGMPENEVRAYICAAFLHDIGKLEIDRQILTKPGPLNEAEREAIKKHPLFGVSFLESIADFQGLLPAIKYHHERYDGKGYPEGLRGEEIPPGARIMALADSYDAMRSKRPYRDALSLEKSIKELQRCAGSQFDPRMVNGFLQVITELEGGSYRGEVAAGKEHGPGDFLPLRMD